MSRPQRTCIGCRQHEPKSQMVRLVWRAGVVVADPRQREPGRAAYLHPRRECLEQAVRRRAAARALRVSPSSASGLEDAMMPFVEQSSPD